VTISREFRWISIECGPQISKPIIKLSHITVITETGDIGDIKFESFLVRNRLGAIGIGFTAIVKG
jgi:hypothetical protein